MIRRVLLATILALATVTTVTASPAQARACRVDHTCYTTYYDDAAHTNVVGALAESCDGTRSMWGRRTGYFDFEESPC